MIDRILKFGSSTLTCNECQKNIISILKKHIKAGERICVVISSQARAEARDRNIAAITRAIPSSKMIVANELSGKALGEISYNSDCCFENIKSYFENSDSNCYITTGFDSSPDSQSGISDYTATTIAAAINAKQVDLYVDVDGIMTANPSKVAHAFSIPKLSFDVATELCHFGAQIIHPLAMQPAYEHNIPIRIKNCLNPDFEGTLISNKNESSPFNVTGVTSIPDIALLRLEGRGMYGVSGIAKRFFDSLSQKEINVILISQASSESSICAAIPFAERKVAQAIIDAEFKQEIDEHKIKPVLVDTDMVIVGVIGANMQKIPGIAGRVFQTLGKNGINISSIAQGSSELNISAVIHKDFEAKALNALHDAFFLSGVTTLNIFQVGVGQVGATLLNQIKEHNSGLKQKGIALKVVGLANSKKMLTCADGIDLDKWEQQLKDGQQSTPTSFAEAAIELNLTNTVFVDCTANEDVANTYESLLKASISVITPNKKANSASYEQYLKLKSLANTSNVKFFYETNVGAGLPIIGTLNDLILSGDKVTKIEAVLSGTLSYIFNTFVAGSSFSEVVTVAKEQGYTEPDPRDDLSGTDVARKLLILSRDLGLKLELEDIEVESLIPDDCSTCKDSAEFLSKLPGSDGYFGDKLQAANTENKVLRYIGIIEDGKAKVALEAVGQDHPFYNLSGTDNIISFITERYSNCPLVVKGPGAGTDVTAAGVLADIVRAASYLAF